MHFLYALSFFSSLWNFPPTSPQTLGSYVSSQCLLEATQWKRRASSAPLNDDSHSLQHCFSDFHMHMKHLLVLTKCRFWFRRLMRGAWDSALPIIPRWCWYCVLEGQTWIASDRGVLSSFWFSLFLSDAASLCWHSSLCIETYRGLLGGQCSSSFWHLYCCQRKSSKLFSGSGCLGIPWCSCSSANLCAPSYEAKGMRGVILCYISSKGNGKLG